MWRMECEETLQFVMPELTNSLTLIVSGINDEDIARGWENLRELEEKSAPDSRMDLEDARTIMRGILRGGVANVRQIPKLMIHFAKYARRSGVTRLDEGDSSLDDYATFVRAAGSRDALLLVSMTEILRDHPIYRGGRAATADACRAIVRALGAHRMPECRDEMIQFRDCAARIGETLRSLCRTSDGAPDADLIAACLETVYATISESSKGEEPGPGLVAVLELVEPGYVAPAVRRIVSEARNDAQLERALGVLCRWIPNWLSVRRLVGWILEFMKSLESAEKYSVLRSVARSHLNSILRCVMFPMSCEDATPLVVAMLRRQPDPLLFRRLTRSFVMVFVQLERQGSETARKCLQELVDTAKALMERFPGYPCYDELEKAFPLEPRIANVMSLRDERVWSDEPARENFSPRDDAPICALRDNAKVGLINLGNTCYMNSVLQALAVTRQFGLEVMRYEYSWNEQASRIMPKLRDLFALLTYSPRRCLSPNEILIASRPEYFAPRQQQDSSEFLCHLLDVVYEQEKSLLMKRIAGTEDTVATRSKGKRSGDSSSPDRGCIKRWTTEEDLSEGVSLQRKTSQSLVDFAQGDDAEDPNARSVASEALSDCHSDSTDSGIQSVDGGTATCLASRDEATNLSRSILVHRVFGGESRITYQCARCDTSSDNTDLFRDLQLCFPIEITDSQIVTVQDLINYYLTPEKLTGDNKYRCDRCAKLCDAQRIIKILTAPSHLILTLKHFRYDADTRLRTKLRHRVIYDETIRLPVAPSDAARAATLAETYRLYAAVVHSGYSMDYGHYVTYARDARKNWYKFNDSYVSRTSLEDFKGLEPPVTPYILFYERTSDRAATRDGNDLDEDDLDDDKDEGNGDANDPHDRPDLSTMPEHVRDLVAKDHRDYEDEMRSRADKKRAKRSSPNGRAIAPPLRRHDNSDDENPPPSSCRGPLDIPANRFLF